MERWHGHLRRWFLTVVPTREDLGEKSIVQDHHSGKGVRVEPRVAAWGGRPPRVRRRRTGAHMSCCTGFHLIDTRLACCRFCSSRYSPHRTRFCSSKNINAPLHLALFFFFFHIYTQRRPTDIIHGPLDTSPSQPRALRDLH